MSTVDDVQRLARPLRPEADVDPLLERIGDVPHVVTAGTEACYRAMVAGGATSWNVGDRHMIETVDRMVGPPGEVGDRALKAVAWEVLWSDRTRALSPLHGVRASGRELETWPHGR